MNRGVETANRPSATFSGELTVELESFPGKGCGGLDDPAPAVAGSEAEFSGRVIGGLVVGTVNEGAEFAICCGEGTAIGPGPGDAGDEGPFSGAAVGLFSGVPVGLGGVELATVSAGPRGANGGGAAGGGTG